MAVTNLIFACFATFCVTMIVDKLICVWEDKRGKKDE